MVASSGYDTDVLVVGSGATGATAALALAGYGIRAHIVSRWNWLADSPRAHITNQRTDEVFRDLGIGDDLARYASPWHEMGDTMFTTDLYCAWQRLREIDEAGVLLIRPHGDVAWRVKSGADEHSRSR